MKKKIIIPVIVVIAMALVLFLPIPQGYYDDGGTRDYNALTYKIVVWNKIVVNLDENGQPVHSTYRKTSVFWYPDNQKSIDELWQMEIAGTKPDASQQQPSTNIIKLEEIENFTQEQLKEELIGLSDADLYRAWGEPVSDLSGMYGAIWLIDDQSEIIVHFDGNGLVMDVLCNPID